MLMILCPAGLLIAAEVCFALLANIYLSMVEKTLLIRESPCGSLWCWQIRYRQCAVFLKLREALAVVLLETEESWPMLGGMQTEWEVGMGPCMVGSKGVEAYVLQDRSGPPSLASLNSSFCMAGAM